MASSSPILPHILELLRPLPGVSARAMFGGHGLFKNGKMFAIVTDGELYFKVTDANRSAFEERGLRPFTYARKGKAVALSYYAAPAECLDDARFMVEWAEQALRAAMKAKVSNRQYSDVFARGKAAKTVQRAKPEKPR